MIPPRTALFGGSFDPPHSAHLAIAAAAAEQAGLDQVIFIPCSISPLKGRAPGADPVRRLEMLEAATEEMPRTAVSDWELRREGPSYSWQTAEHFTGLLPEGGQLFWLLGADQWAQLHRWARADYLAALVEFLVFAREGAVIEPRSGFRARTLSGVFSGSSTEVRRRCAAGEPLSPLVPGPVEQIIKRDGLYRA